MYDTTEEKEKNWLASTVGNLNLLGKASNNFAASRSLELNKTILKMRNTSKCGFRKIKCNSDISGSDLL